MKTLIALLVVLGINTAIPASARDYLKNGGPEYAPFLKFEMEIRAKLDPEALALRHQYKQWQYTPQQDDPPKGQARRSGGRRAASRHTPLNAAGNPAADRLRHDANSPNRQPATRTPTGGADGAIRLAPVAELGSKDLGDGLIHWVAYWVARSITWDAGRTAVEI